MGNGRVRYLEQGEKQETRALYAAAFPEDSQKFIDYYYTWKILENEIIVMEGAGNDSSFHVMVHLNPYHICICKAVREIFYIVAVATAREQRRQGKMGQVMQNVLQDMARREIPFTFLLPADPAYYRGQGFAFFPNQKACIGEKIGSSKEGGTGNLRAASLEYSACWQKADTRDAYGMAAFSNGILEQRYGIYIRRDAHYYCRLLMELGTESGGAVILKENERICGSLLYSISAAEGTRTAEIKELLLENEIFEEDAKRLCKEIFDRTGIAVNDIKFTSSRMMVRITDLFALVPLLKCNVPVSFTVKASDGVINKNNGCFQIEINQRGGRIKRIAERLAGQEMDIVKLAEKLFKDTPVYLNEWV